MNKKVHTLALLASGFLPALVLAQANANALGLEPGYGPNPPLPEPTRSLIPTVEVAKPKPLPEGQTLKAAEGLAVTAFATELSHPRTVYPLPNGDLLVVETNAPQRPDEGKSIKGVAMKLMMKKAGAAVPSPDRITLLRDADGDGRAETRSTLLKNLHSPFGVALVGDSLFVANTDAVVRFPYKEGDTEINAAPQKVADLPAGTINHHWTKSLVANQDGTKLYVGVGSNSNVGENGIDQEKERATILEIDLKTGQSRVFASGLRNPAALAIESASGALWAAVNERDELGDDLVPDYMTAVKEGAFYGWPYSYFGQHVDTRIKQEDRQPELVAKAVVPDYALGAHTACLGLAFAKQGAWPSAYHEGVFVGQHGSWNRKTPSGYRVIFVPFEQGRPSGAPVPVLTGFLDQDGKVFGRPVGVAVDKNGALFVADDVGNRVWRVTGANGPGAATGR